MSDEMAEILNDFLVESHEMLDLLDQRFIALESDPTNSELLNEIFRAMHSMKGSAGFLGFTHLVNVTHRGESILNKVRQGEMALDPFIVTIILEAVDVIKLLMTDIKDTGTDLHVPTDTVANKLDLILSDDFPKEAAPTVVSSADAGAEPSAAEYAEAPDPLSVEAVSVPEVAELIPAVVGTTPKVERKPEAPHPVTDASDAAKQAKPVKSEEDQTVRVETRRLDSVMNLVGEMVLGRNRLMKIGAGLESAHENDPLARELGETLARLSLVTTDLQLAVMKTRMLPIKKVLAKFPRMVRDLSKQLGKQVRLEMEGEDTELDKSVADEIGDPLVHLVRNSIDHGIEMPADRLATGKPPEGLIKLSACQEGNSIVIRITDDGRGLQVERIKAKALEKGLVTESELAVMDAKAIMSLIFLPGFSTAEHVTDVSGRGVGMDVVRTNIRKINGAVDLDSIPGQGSVVTIKLPLTIAIIQALVVGVSNQVFAIPLASVVEAVKVSQGYIKSVGGREVMTLRDRVIPLLRLGDEFEIPNAERARDRGYVVVISTGDRRLGIIVDRLHAQEEVVIKPLGEFLGNIKGVAGATITGDGKVILILDVGEFVGSARYERTDLFAGVEESETGALEPAEIGG